MSHYDCNYCGIYMCCGECRSYQITFDNVVPQEIVLSVHDCYKNHKTGVSCGVCVEIAAAIVRHHRGWVAAVRAHLKGTSTTEPTPASPDSGGD